jgi:hypothetical protein
MKAEGIFENLGVRKAGTGSTARRLVHDERAGPRPAALPPLRGNNNGPTSSRTHSSGTVVETMRRAHLGVVGAAAAPVIALPRGFINAWRSRADTRQLLDQAHAVIYE